MAHWDYRTGTVIRAPAEWNHHYEGWLWFDCGCSNGLEWGGETPRECRRCKGTASLAVHVESRTVAEYPGGPLAGERLSEARLQAYLGQASDPSTQEKAVPASHAGTASEASLTDARNDGIA